MKKYDLEGKLREICAKKTHSELSHERSVRFAIAIPLLAAAAVSTAYAFSPYFKKQTKVSETMHTNIPISVPVKVEFEKPIVIEETKSPKFSEQNTSENKDKEDFIKKAENAYNRAVYLSNLRDPKDGKVYSHTLKELELLLDNKNVSEADKRYVGRIIKQLKVPYHIQMGWVPIAYQKVSSYLKNEKNVKEENLQKTINSLLQDADISFVEGGRIDIFMAIKDNNKTVFSHGQNFTPNEYIGGNVEEVLIRALKSAGYTD